REVHNHERRGCEQRGRPVVSGRRPGQAGKDAASDFQDSNPQFSESPALKRYAFILGLFTFCASGFAYTRITVSTGETPRWASMPVTYWINEKGFSKITNGSDFLAIHSSFQTWKNVASADVQFVYGGATPAPGVGRGRMNLVSFTPPSPPLPPSPISPPLS